MFRGNETATFKQSMFSPQFTGHLGERILAR